MLHQGFYSCLIYIFFTTHSFSLYSTQEIKKKLDGVWQLSHYTIGDYTIFNENDLEQIAEDLNTAIKKKTLNIAFLDDQKILFNCLKHLWCSDYSIKEQQCSNYTFKKKIYISYLKIFSTLNNDAKAPIDTFNIKKNAFMLNLYTKCNGFFSQFYFIPEDNKIILSVSGMLFLFIKSK